MKIEVRCSCGHKIQCSGNEAKIICPVCKLEHYRKNNYWGSSPDIKPFRIGYDAHDKVYQEL